MYCGLVILQRSRDQSAQGPTFYASVLNMQMRPVDFFFFLSLRPSSDSIKNPLVIRFCAAVGSAFSFFLPTTVGDEEKKGGGVAIM